MVMVMMMMMTKTHIIKRGLANGKFDGFSAVSHQLNHMVPGRPDEDEDEFRQIFWISAFLFWILCFSNDGDGDADDRHLATSSPLIERIWSPGISLSTLGPPPVTNLNWNFYEISVWFFYAEMQKSTCEIIEKYWSAALL